MRHFLPKRSSSEAASSRPKSALTQQPRSLRQRLLLPPNHPSLNLDDVPAWPNATIFRNDRDPGPRWHSIPRRRRRPDQKVRKRRGPCLAAAGPPPKLLLVSSQSPRPVPGAVGDVFATNSEPVQAPNWRYAAIATKIKQTVKKR